MEAVVPVARSAASQSASAPNPTRNAANAKSGMLMRLGIASPLPACGERSDREAIRVRGDLGELSRWKEPLTPTLSPQAGRGSAHAVPHWPTCGKVGHVG